MSIFNRITRFLTRTPESKKHPEPKTMDHVLHRLWTERVGQPGYDYEEKRLWMALQRFVERKGGLRESLEDYKV